MHLDRPAARARWCTPAAAAAACPWRRHRPCKAPPAAACNCSSNASQDSDAGTPLLDAVMERGSRTHEAPFHLPGHKRGGGAPPGLRALLGGAMTYDLTELAGLDVLSAASGPIAAAQQAAADAWGAGASFFLVNGSTAGIHAAVMATCGPGDALILARNAHLSAFNACVLAGCTPVYAQPVYDPGLGVAHQLTPAALADAFDAAEAAGLRVAAALVVSPTYFGVMSDVAGLAAVCRGRGVPLLVDEAHGAHLGLHPGLPPSALQRGADVAVQSTHKQLAALTQAGMLHVARGGRVQAARLAAALRVLQSSSPSYLLMASLDAARAQAAQPAAHEESLAAAALARQRLAALPGVQLLTAGQAAACEASSSSSSIALDPLRLTLSLQSLGLSGYEVAEALERRFGVVPELATPTCVVLALSIGSTVQHARALVAAVEQLCSERGGGAAGSGGSSSSNSSSLQQAAAIEVRMSPRDAFYAASEAVPAERAVGRVSAELLCPYPPGVPAAYPGEVLTAAVLQQLRAVLAAGGTVTGCSDASLQTLRVVAA